MAQQWEHSLLTNVARVRVGPGAVIKTIGIYALAPVQVNIVFIYYFTGVRAHCNMCAVLAK